MGAVMGAARVLPCALPCAQVMASDAAMRQDVMGHGHPCARMSQVLPCARYVSCHAAMPSQLLSQLDRLAKHDDGRLLARAAVQPLRLLACLEHIEHAVHAQ